MHLRLAVHEEACCTLLLLKIPVYTQFSWHAVWWRWWSQWDRPSLTLYSRRNHWSSRVSLISDKKGTCSYLSYRIKGFYCAAKRNKNSLRREKSPTLLEREKERENPIAVTGWTDKFKAKKEIKLLLREGCGKGYKLKKRDRATRGKYKSHDKSKMRFSDMARQKVPKTASLCMCCKKNAREHSLLCFRQGLCRSQAWGLYIHLTLSSIIYFQRKMGLGG